jgi:hypothetical protein
MRPSTVRVDPSLFVSPHRGVSDQDTQYKRVDHFKISGTGNKFFGFQCATCYRKRTSALIWNSLLTEGSVLEIHDIKLQILLKFPKMERNPSGFSVRRAKVRVRPSLCPHCNCFPRKERSKYFIHNPADPFGDH